MKKLYSTFANMLVALLLLTGFNAFAQSPTIENMRPNSKEGLNTFEPKKEIAEEPFDGIKVRIGGDFALQLQGLNQTNTLDSLSELGTNLNLPTANFRIDVQLYDGVRMHLMTYLSSRHHAEAWVKGGFVQFDKLDFIKEGFLGNFMQNAYIRVGMDEINYGDAHFRRTDNARAIFNPFVGNYIMDAFTTEAFGEVVVQTNNGLIGVLGVSNGKLNQRVTVNDNTDNSLSFYGKLGFDRQVNDDLRVRLTGSWYMNNGTTTGTYLYGGDRAGSRYYQVMTPVNQGDSHFDGRFNPRFKQNTSFQLNPFIKMGGLEFFGIYEVASNSQDELNGSFTQTAGELIYRFGSTEQLYVAGRYNSVNGSMAESGPEQTINRINVGGGWFLTNNILAKLEYVKQTYDGEGWDGSRYEGGEFSGLVFEAAISF